mgnify:CR=1 FL=1
MATFTPIKNQKQTKGALLGTMLYAINTKKTTYEGQSLVSGFNCSAYTSYLEMMTTKQQFFQFVQSFPEDTDLTPQVVHRIGMELAARQFPDYEVLVATHATPTTSTTTFWSTRSALKPVKSCTRITTIWYGTAGSTMKSASHTASLCWRAITRGRRKSVCWRENTAPPSGARAGSLR